MHRRKTKGCRVHWNQVYFSMVFLSKRLGTIPCLTWPFFRDWCARPQFWHDKLHCYRVTSIHHLPTRYAKHRKTPYWITVNATYSGLDREETFSQQQLQCHDVCVQSTKDREKSRIRWMPVHGGSFLFLDFCTNWSKAASCYCTLGTQDLPGVRPCNLLMLEGWNVKHRTGLLLKTPILVHCAIEFQRQFFQRCCRTSVTNQWPLGPCVKRGGTKGNAQRLMQRAWHNILQSIKFFDKVNESSPFCGQVRESCRRIILDKNTPVLS